MLPAVDDKQQKILQRYSHLFVDCPDAEVQQLYHLLSLFFAKCDGLLSQAEVQRLEDLQGGSAIRSLFSPYLTPVERRDSILARLKFLKQYKISKPSELIRVLTPALFVAGKIDPRDRKYLVEFAENPSKSLKWFADRLSVNLSSVTRAYQRLRKDIEFRFYYTLNFPLFRLKHYFVYFRPNEFFRREMLSSREITRSLNCDTFGEWMWATFLVPNQNRILKEFTGSLAEFAEERFLECHVYQAMSFAKHCNLSMFDGEKWFFSEEAVGIGAFKHADANKEIIPRLDESMYGDAPVKFDQVDFMLSLLLSSESVAKNAELRKYLQENGLGVLSQTAVSNRLARLKGSRAFFPACNFTGLGLDTAVAIAVECNDEVLETFYHMFPLLPDCWAYRTEKGVIAYLRIPSGMFSRVSYLMQTLKDETQNLIMTSRFENAGSRTWRHLVKYWDAEKQYWDFERGFFDLCKGLAGSS